MPSPIGHCLMACSLYSDRSPVRRRSWWTLLAFVFFANAPDLDFIPGLFLGHPQMFHRTLTHSLAFAVGTALLSSLVFAWKGRVEAGRMGRLVFFALLSHLALDYFCSPGKGSGLMLLWPLTAERFAAPSSVFPLLTHEHVMSWGNVLAVSGEAALMSIVLFIALLRRWISERALTVERRRVTAPEPAYSVAEVGE
jgi:inner membrane protein